MNPIVSTLIKGMLYLILKAKQGGKYLDRKKVVDRKTGKMRYKYKYKPMQQRAAHEVTRGKFEKVTKLSGDEHKNQIEHALQNGIHVSLHVLRDYPDLAVKYHQQARLAKADKIRAKVKTHKEKERMEREVRLNTPEGLKNNPIKLEAERMMREDGLIKDVPVSDNREVENNFDTMPESKPEPAKIVNEPAIPDKAVTDFIKKKKAQALGYGGSGKLISQSVFDNSKEMEFLTKYKDIITDTQLDPSISKQQANLLQYLPTDLSKKNYELVSDKDNNDKRYNVQKKLIDFSNQLKTKQLASNVIAELQKILSTHEYHTGDYTSNVDILLKRIEPYQRISSNTSPAKPPDLKANFESWKEERKTAVSEPEAKAPVSPKETDTNKIMTSLDKHIQKEYLAKNPNFKPTSSKTLAQYEKEVFSENPNWLKYGNFYNSDEKAKAIEKQYNKNVIDEYYYGFGSDDQFAHANAALFETIDLDKAKLNRYYGDKHLLTKDQFAKVLDATDPKNKEHYLQEWTDSIKNSSNGETPSGKKIPKHVLESVNPPKTAAPAFKLEQEDLTSKEKNTRFNDAQGGLFGKKPVTHESYAKKDFKPALALEGNETITSLVTAVKSALMREGLDTKAREFVDKAFKEKDINSLKKLASEYVELKNNAQVSNPSTENKGSEEKKMSQLKGKDMPIEGNETIHERFYENNGYYVDISVVDKKPTIWIGNGSNKKEVSPSAGGVWWIEEPDKFMTKKLKESGAKPSNYISVSGSPVRKEAKAAIESAIKRFEELKNQDPFEQKWTERRRLEKLKFPSGKIEEIENSLEDDRRGFNKFMESEEDYSKLKTSKYTYADLEAEYAKYPKFVAHRKLKNSTDRTTDPDELSAIYAKMAELEKS